MPATVIHVDFKTRRIINEPVVRNTYKEDVQAILRALTTPAADGTVPEKFLEPPAHVLGCLYEATRGIPLRDLTTIVREYAKDTYPALKFRIYTRAKTMHIDIVDAAHVAVRTPGKDGYSDAIDEIFMDLEGFANQFNDPAYKYHFPRFYVTKCVYSG